MVRQTVGESDDVPSPALPAWCWADWPSWLAWFWADWPSWLAWFWACCAKFDMVGCTS